MADIRIKDLPVNVSVNENQYIATDLSTTERATIRDVVDAGAPIASQSEAEAGENSTKRMTPLTTLQSINANAASKEQGDLADTALQPTFLPIVNVLRYRKYDVSNYGASPLATASQNTVRIQSAINEAFLDGGGEVFVPLFESGIYQTQSSVETDVFQLIASGPSITTGIASDYVSLLLRSRVHLVMDDGVVIENQRNDRTILGLVDMAGGGVYNGTLRSLWTPGASGAGHGIFTFVTGDVNNSPNRNIEIDGVEIGNVASYGLGMQYGFFKNNKYRNLHIHDTGADGIDHKARPLLDGTIPTGMVAENILVERWGRRTGITASAAIDIRGALKVSNFTAREGAYEDRNNTGIRCSAGLWNQYDKRVPSQGAIVENFDVDAGDPTITGTKGLVLLDSGAIVVGGNVRNFDQGVSIENSSSGYGSNEGGIVSDIRVFSSRQRSFYSSSPRVKIVDCEARGQNETFEASAGNLIAGQTIFTSISGIDATATVEKNGIKLTEGSQYTRSGNTVTLFSGVGGGDVVRLIVPTPVGFRIDAGASYNSLLGCTSQYVTAPRSVDSAADATLLEVGCRFEDLSSVATIGGSANVSSYARGPGADVEYEIYPKGGAGVTLRSRNSRTLRAVNPTGTETNWVQVSGSADGAPVSTSAQGASGDIEFSVEAKGNSGVSLKSRASIALVALNSTDNSVNYLEAQGSAGTSPVSLYARGTSVNIDLEIYSKGNSGVSMFSNGGRAFSAYNSVANVVNYLQANGTVSGGGSVALAAQGTDANLDIRLLPKGTTGRVRFGTFTVNADAPVTGYIEVRDAGGNIRKLATIA